MFIYKEIILLPVLIAVLSMTGCVRTSQIRSSLDKVDESWEVRNSNLSRTLGTRVYIIGKKDAFHAMVKALTQLGFNVINKSIKTGVISAKAPMPTPLTDSEWHAIKKIEEPKMQALIAPIVGELASRSARLHDQNYDVILKVIFHNNLKGLQISFHYKVEFTGPKNVVLYGKQPPPEAVKYSIKKTWDIFDKIVYESANILFKVQYALNSKGYNSGQPDDMWGGRTRAALKNFQRDHNLKITGELDSISLEALGIESRLTESSDPSVKPKTASKRPNHAKITSLSTTVNAGTSTNIIPDAAQVNRSPAGEEDLFVTEVSTHEKKFSQSVRTPTKVNLYFEPDPFSEIIDIIQKNKWLGVISEGSDWLKVEYGGVIGFVVRSEVQFY